jgi:hypothetical protein
MMRGGEVMKRKGFLAILLATLMFTMAIPKIVSADTQPLMGIDPYWANVMNIPVSLSFSGTTANCQAQVNALSGTTSITGTATLDRENSNGAYTTVYTWTGLSSTTTILNFSGTCTISTGYTYRLTITVTVVRNGVSEVDSNWVTNTP